MHVPEAHVARPPETVSSGVAASMRGPGRSPALMALRMTMSAAASRGGAVVLVSQVEHELGVPGGEQRVSSGGRRPSIRDQHCW